MPTPIKQVPKHPNQTANSNELIVPVNFIRAVRESGYISLSTAIAELIDNSIQAEADTVRISIKRPAPTDRPQITITDNGIGMNKSVLEACLRFGGTLRFDDRQSFGRFGMGLPAASLSQSRHVEVVSWQDGGAAMEVCLDVDDVVSRGMPSLRPRRSKFPSQGLSGCAVVWRDCDRIEYQRLSWLERALHRDLGRMYRRFITAGLALEINGTKVKSRDPLMQATSIEGKSATLAFDAQRYEVATSDGRASSIIVRFSVLPIEAWNHLDNATKRRAGIVGGGGVSILRAGREIAFGWHLMGGKRRENYDDWWRCEIEFAPDLDEQFGITINKQGIRPTVELRKALEPELESVARLLNSRVRQAFEEVKFRAATNTSCAIAEAADPHLPVLVRHGRKNSTGAIGYRLSSAAVPSGVMFKTNLEGRVIGVELNIDHPAFAAIYEPLQRTADETGTNSLRTALELLFLSFARATLSSGRIEIVNDLVQTWSNTYATMLQRT